jgi:hypothetical protein
VIVTEKMGVEIERLGGWFNRVLHGLQEISGCER